MCGYGDTITVSDKGNVNNSAFYGVVDEKTIDKHVITTVGFLPNGDDDRFADCNIPNISVCTLRSKDIDFFQYIGKLLIEGKQPTEEDRKQFLSLDVLSTMHLGENDNILSCNQHCIDKVTQWLLDGLIS